MVVIALAAVAALGWGASDFFGGDSSGRGLPVFTVVAVSELLGAVMLISVLAVRGPPDLDGPAAALAVIAGFAVTAELSLIYSALGRGDSFATAPVSALGTAFAVAAGLVTGDPLSVAVMFACLHAAGQADPYWATALEHAGTALSAGLIGLRGRLGLRRLSARSVRSAGPGRRRRRRRGSRRPECGPLLARGTPRSGARRTVPCLVPTGGHGHSGRGSRWRAG